MNLFIYNDSTAEKLNISSKLKQVSIIFGMEDETSFFYRSSIDSLLFPTPPKNECGLFFPVMFL
jgi:hypothetical protein